MRAVIENIYGAVLLAAMICAPAGVPLVAILLWVTWTGAELRMPLWAGAILAVLIVPAALFTSAAVMPVLREMVAAARLPMVTVPVAEFVLMNGMVFGGILLIVEDPLVALLMTVALACIFRALEPLIERLEKNAPPMEGEA